MVAVKKLTRRQFFKGTSVVAGSGLLLGVTASSRPKPAVPLIQEENAFKPNAFLQIDPDGKTTIVVARSEMGQGVRTSMAMLVAEELSVPWESITIVQGDGDPKYGNQNTDGSTSVRTQWQPLRTAGATAKAMLIAAAAGLWNVDVASCEASQGAVHHSESKRSKAYGELATLASRLPAPDKVKLKDAKDFTIIGQPKPMVDNQDIVTGKAGYGIDVRLPNMKYASLERCPVVGGSLKSFNADKAKAVAGVSQVTAIKPAGPPANTFHAIAVVADSTWAAFQGRKALEVTWEEGTNATENSLAMRQNMQAQLNKNGKPFRSEGKTYEEMVKGNPGATHEAFYHSPYLAHSPMEPLVCTAHVTKDACEIWAPTQAPQWAGREIAKVLGLKPEQVTVHVTLLGGGFGRKSKPDFVVEAAMVAKEVKGPVQVVWSREDEIKHGYYRSENMQYFYATLDREGLPKSWLHRTCFPTILTTFNPEAKEMAGWEMSQGATTIPYRIPNIQVEATAVHSGLRLGWMRSVHHTFHAWGVNGFMDELAEKTGIDPIDYHLKAIGDPRIIELTDQDKKNPFKYDTGRLRHVIEQVRKKSDWDKPTKPGIGLGFATHYSFFSYVAMVAQVNVQNSSKMDIEKVVAVIDCGQVVNPDTVRAQMEGAIVFGLSMALYGEITLEKGRVKQSNFHDYRMLRINDMPKVEIHIVPSKAAPTGVGEPGVPPLTPALVNAIYKATGKRFRQLPLST